MTIQPFFEVATIIRLLATNAILDLKFPKALLVCSC